MIKPVASLILLGFLVVSCGDSSSTFEKSRRSVVSLTTRFVNTQLPLKPENRNGSGFFVSNELIITAFHVLQSMEQEVAKYPEGKVKIFVEWTSFDGSSSFSFPVERGLTDEGSDLAILKIDPDLIRPFVESGNLAVLELENWSPSIGDEVIMSGYNIEEDRTFTVKGNISLISERDERKRGLPPKTIFCDLTSLPANSGAAILSASSGHVVGVYLGALTWGSTATGMAYAANLASLQQLVSKQNEAATSVK